jgi:hypothetical protein
VKTLDRTRDYGEVWGATGHAGYVQDDCEFGIDGTLKFPEQPIAVELAAPARQAEPKIAGKKGATPASAAAPVERSDDELKTMVEIAGGTWTDRAAATAFLSE